MHVVEGGRGELHLIGYKILPDSDQMLLSLLSGKITADQY